MKDKYIYLYHTLLWLTLYFVLAIIFYAIIDSIQIFELIYTDVAVSLFIPGLLVSPLIYKSEAKSFFLSFDSFTFSRMVFIVISPLPIFILLLGLLYLAGADITQNPQFKFDSYFLDMTLILLILSFFEELVFRGFIFGFLANRYNKTPIILLSSIAFSLAHFSNPGIESIAALNIFLAGIFLSVLYLKTENILYPTIFHFFWNISQQFFLNSAISGNNIDLNFFTIEYPLNNFLLDSFFISKFGIESSILTTIILLLLVIFTLKQQQSPYISSAKLRTKYYS